MNKIERLQKKLKKAAEEGKWDKAKEYKNKINTMIREKEPSSKVQEDINQMINTIRPKILFGEEAAVQVTNEAYKEANEYLCKELKVGIDYASHRDFTTIEITLHNETLKKLHTIGDACYTSPKDLISHAVEEYVATHYEKAVESDKS